MQEKYEICCSLFHGFSWGRRGRRCTGGAARPAARRNGKDRCLRSVQELSQAFALAVPHEDAVGIRDDVAFFQAVRSALVKRVLRNYSYPPDKQEKAIRTVLAHAEVLSAGWAV